MLIRDIDVSYNFLVLVVRRSDNTLHWINLYPVDNSVRFATTYRLYSDFSVGKRYPPFTQLGPDLTITTEANLIWKAKPIGYRLPSSWRLSYLRQCIH